METLISFLAGSGRGSRRSCFDLLVNGNVTVNSLIERRSSVLVNPATDVVRIDGSVVAHTLQKVYLMLNKPEGVLSTTSDKRGRPTVIDLLPSNYGQFRLFPVGRLDMNTTGLLILTNDGNLANRLTHPRYNIEKEYQALLDKPLLDKQLSILRRGIVINGHAVVPDSVYQSYEMDERLYSITIHEGRKRLVRLMFMALGRVVCSLKRVRIHTLTVGTLSVGSVRDLSTDEIDKLMDSYYD